MVIIFLYVSLLPMSFHLSPSLTTWLFTKNTAFPSNHPTECSFCPALGNKYSQVSFCLLTSFPAHDSLPCFFGTDPCLCHLQSPSHSSLSTEDSHLPHSPLSRPGEIIYSLSYQYSQFLVPLPFQEHSLRKTAAVGLNPIHLFPSILKENTDSNLSVAPGLHGIPLA